jgi:glycerophosphoryl diester phosphodiesterase
MYDGQTLIFGHRGARAYAPMNTLPAFELAIEQGAHGIELDVQRSRDGRPVIMHNSTVDETTDSTGFVAQMTVSELKALDSGSWFNATFAKVQIPTLDEVFETVGRRVFVNVEIKLETDETDGVEQAVADCIARHNMQSFVIVSSFKPRALKRFRAIMPDIPIGFIYKPEIPFEVHLQMADFPYETYNPRQELITADLVTEAAQAGHLINAWVVNDPQPVYHPAHCY